MSSIQEKGTLVPPKEPYLFSLYGPVHQVCSLSVSYMK